jgi:hypothetical protein
MLKYKIARSNSLQLTSLEAKAGDVATVTVSCEGAFAAFTAF